MTSNPKYSISGTFTQGTVSDEIADFLLAKTFVAVYLQTAFNTNPSTFSQQRVDVSVVQKVSLSSTIYYRLFSTSIQYLL
jgi:hypothetical protein